MIKILFFIHDLGQGGAEKVLVNLVNNMDSSKFDISVTALFGGGVNEQFLKPHIHYRAIWSKAFPGNSHVMKLFTPRQLHRICVKEHYDIEVSYLEGPSARIISGCGDKTSKLVSWIHVEQHTPKKLAQSFRSVYEAKKCYSEFDYTVCVSEYVKNDFTGLVLLNTPCTVLYNTIETETIKSKSYEDANKLIQNDLFRVIAVGSLKPAKGFDRLFRIITRLNNEGYNIHLYVLGIGPEKPKLEAYITENKCNSFITLLGYDTNPYKYVKKCNLFVCSSFAEGFSTAATEALIVGTPVCTVEVSGMKEMLGDNNEYGIVTDNSEEALYSGIKMLIDDPALLEHYREQATIRGKLFSTENTVKAVEEMFIGLIDN